MEPDAAGLERLWQALGDGSGVQTFGLRELARAWFGDDAGAAAEEQMQQALDAPQPFFVPLPGVPGLWRVPAAVEVRRAQAAQAGGGRPGGRPGARADQAGIQAIVDRRLAQAQDLYRRSVDPQTGAVTLGFYFPDVAAQRYAEAIAAIRDEAGVEVVVSTQPHQGMLAEAALAALPEGLAAARSPSILFEERIVRVKCEGAAEQTALDEARQRFAQRTGWRLDIVMPTPAPAVTLSAVAPDTAVDPLEYNKALWVAGELFGPETGCYKIGADQQAGVLTLRFDFPDVARVRYAGQLEDLAAGTGWRVQIHPHPNQGALAEAARRALPAGLEPIGAPSISAPSREVLVRCRGAADEAVITAAQAAFKELTGWSLVIRAA